MTKKEKEKITNMLDTIFEDFRRIYDWSDRTLEKVKTLEYQLEDLKEACVESRKDLGKLYKHFGIEEEI